MRRLSGFVKSCYERLRAYLRKDTVSDILHQPEQRISDSNSGGTIQSEFDGALACHQRGKLDEAESIYRSILQRQSKHPEALHFLGVVQAQRENLAEAAELIGRAIEIDPGNAAAHSNYGNVLRGLKRSEEAIASYDRALALNADSAEALNNRGAVLRDLGRHEDALMSYERALTINPDYVDALNNRGVALLSLGRHQDALYSFDRILGINSAHMDALMNRARVFLALSRYDDALAGCEQVLAFMPDSLDALIKRGEILVAKNRYTDALASFDMALALKPDFAEAHNHRGILLARLNRHAEALASYDRAIVFDPDYVEAFNNRGVVLALMKRHDEALHSYDRALEMRPDFAGFLNNRGGLLRNMKLHERAAQDYSRLFELEPEFEHALSNKLYSNLHVCNWKQYHDDHERLVSAVRDGKRASLPFTFLVMCDADAEQLMCARIYVADQYPLLAKPLWTGERYRHERIRIAYLSADFYRHATAHLMAELFEKHDTSRFEVSAWSFGPDFKDDMHTRLRSSFEQFNDVRGNSDIEVATMLRKQEIDISIDLKGFTGGSRTAIFAHRAAPIQVNYLGYPGTMGAEYIDYIIGDAHVIPPGHEAYYSEKVVRMPDTYQVNDSTRAISGQTFSRADAKLPGVGFVFCCFNKSYKIVPEVFDVWMRLLKNVDGSVLWLFEDNAAATRNLKLEAESRGVSADRLVFASHKPPSSHLARHRLADLFLDTLPCNAHTTASDALWAGLPILTCKGSAFPGRVAASLLRAVGLPELITENLADYEALAFKLATTPAMLNDLKAQLARNKDTYPLFNADRFRRHIESAYTTMYERYQRGEPPQSFSVQAIP